jgi:oligopeptide transport system substrate-binding protein
MLPDRAGAGGPQRPPGRGGHPATLLVAALLLGMLWCGICAAGLWAASRVLDRATLPVPRPVAPSPAPADARAGAPTTAVTGTTRATSAAGEPVAGGTLRLPGGDPLTLDPALVGDVTSAEYIYEIFSGLVTLSPALEVVPDLAERWNVSPSGTVYTFTLRADARFQDGTPVTADAVAFGIERACDPATASPVAETYLGDIVGCIDRLSGRASAVAGVHVLDDRRLELTIDAPKAYFLAKLTYPTSFALDRRQVTTDADWLSHPNGSGPFRLSTFNPGEQLLLERNDGYYGGAPTLDAVAYDLRPADPLTRYENGELDATPVGAADVERVRDPLNPLSGEVVEGAGDLSLSYIGFNMHQAPFDDVHVRRAFNLALDKRRLAEVVMQGAVRPIDTILPPGMPGYQADLVPYPFDPAAARAELAASRYGGPDGVPAVTLDVAGEGGAPVAEAVADFISATLGVAVTVEQTPWQTYQGELDAGAYDMFMLGWAADYADPQDFLDVLFHGGSPLNHGGYANDEVDALLEAARVESDQARRLALYNQAEGRILDDAPWLPLQTGVDTWLVAPNVHGFTLPAIVRPRMARVWMDPS